MKTIKKSKSKIGLATVSKFFLIILIFILLFFINIIVIGAISEGDVEWTDPQENTLSLSENFSRENYIIEATDFYEDSVLITVYNKTFDNILMQQIAKTGDSWNVTDNDNITRMNIFIKELKIIRGNISANEGLNVVVDQRVKILTKLVGRPNPILSIAFKERKLNNRTFVDRIFTPGSEVSVNFSIKNEGKATLRNVHLIINKSEMPFLFPNENSDRELPDLKANETNIINIRYIAPNVMKRKNFTISAYVRGTDEFGRRYKGSDSANVIVKPFIENIVEVKKFVPEKIYMGDVLYVTLNIKNNGFTNLTGHLIEEIPPGFEPLDEMWNLPNFTLNRFENKYVLYKLKPKKPGIFQFPSSIVQWEDGIGNEGVTYSQGNRSIVNGPYVELKKVGKIEGDQISISVIARNFGDMTAIVRLRDFIPKGMPISKSLIVHSGGSATFSYSINKANITNLISDGKVTLPPARAVILDQFLFTNERYNQVATSNELNLNMSE